MLDYLVLESFPGGDLLRFGWLQLDNNCYLPGILQQIINLLIAHFLLHLPIPTFLTRPRQSPRLQQFLHRPDIAILNRIVEGRLMVKAHLIHIDVTFHEIVDYGVVVVQGCADQGRPAFVVAFVEVVVIGCDEFLDSGELAFFYCFEEGVGARFLVWVGVLPEGFVDIRLVLYPEVSGLLQGIHEEADELL